MHLTLGIFLWKPGFSPVSTPIAPVFISVFCAIRKSGGYFPIRRTLGQYSHENLEIPTFGTLSSS